MDHDDYVQISRALTEINKHEDQLRETVNKQTNINIKMMNRFTEIKELISNNSNIITRELEVAENRTTNLLRVISLDQNLYQISYTIEILYEHFQNIAETVTLAKLQVISHHILSHEEIHYIHDHINKQNVFVKSDNSLYNLLTLQAYYNKSVLILSIQIPNFHADELNHHILQPTNINSTYTIPIPFTSIISNDRIYQYITTPCTQVEDILYCHQEHLSRSAEHCITQLIYNQPANCTLLSTTYPDTVLQILPSYIYVSTLQPIEFYSTCMQTQRNIQGIKLIHFHNCTITIYDKNYTNHVLRQFDDTLMLQPYNDIVIDTIYHPVNITTLNNWTLHNTMDIQRFHHRTLRNETHQYVSWGILTFVLLTIILCIYFRSYPPKGTALDTQPNVQKSFRFWPSLRREELRPVDHLPSSTVQISPTI